MKKNLSILLSFLFLCGFIFGCAGVKQTKKTINRDSIAGTKEIQKGITWYRKGCFTRAYFHFTKANELYTAADSLIGAAISLNNMGNVYRIQGEAAQALLFYDEALDLFATAGDTANQVQALSNKAAALIATGQFNEAEKALKDASAFQKKSTSSYIPLLINKGVLHTKKMEFEEAEKVLKSALRKADPSNSSEFAAINFAMGNLKLAFAKTNEAEQYFLTALKADKTTGYYKGMADGLFALGEIANEMGEYAKASGFLKRSAKIYALIGDRNNSAMALGLLLITAEKSGEKVILTELMIQKWLSGKALESPCE